MRLPPNAFVTESREGESYVLNIGNQVDSLVQDMLAHDILYCCCSRVCTMTIWAGDWRTPSVVGVRLTMIAVVLCLRCDEQCRKVKDTGGSEGIRREV